MNYPFWVSIITTDKDLANAAAALIDPDDGSCTFGALRLRRPGEAISAWASSIPLTANGKALFDEFVTAGPWPMLAAIGINNVEQLKTVLTLEHGTRAELEGRLGAFTTEQGYERVTGLPP